MGPPRPTTSAQERAHKASVNGTSSKGQLIIRGARQHNLKNLDLTLPRNRLIVLTGPSGSGKSSLAFDTIYAEGQRRYVESLSAYARQFLERMDRPDLDNISGLSPAIAIEQKNTSRNPRSTVATATEIYDHLRLLYARIGETVSPVSGEIVTRDTPTSVADEMVKRFDEGTRFFLCFPLPRHAGHKVSETLESLRQQGFFRIHVAPTDKQRENGEVAQVVDLNETPPDAVRFARDRMSVLVDRLVVREEEGVKSRIADSVETAFREGGGRCAIFVLDGPELHFSEFFERDGMQFEEPVPHLFSFNNPYGACPECQGFGSVAGIDPNLVIPNEDLSIRQGAIAPFRTEQWSKYLKDLIRVAARISLPIDSPYGELSDEHRRLIWEGHGEFAGIDGLFRYLERRAYKMHYRIFRARFQGYTRCPACDGFRLRAAALYIKVGGMHIGEVSELTIADASDFFNDLRLTEYETAVAGRVLTEIRKRLKYLNEVGLDYLTLDRQAQTLSGGESQRINLATSLGSSLVGSLYVLDEPSIGLHPRDTDRLIRILEHLRDIGNTVIVVEHDPETMRRSDQILDLGPGAGRSGGEIMFQGPYDDILNDPRSLTGAYLAGRKSVPVPAIRRRIREGFELRVINARAHNLKRLDVSIPLGMIACVTGVSGSGKSTLVHHTLFAGLRRIKNMYEGKVGAHDAIKGHHLIDQVEMVDQSPIGRTPRSNPVTYIKVFDSIRELLANTHQSNVRGYKPGYFSFNVPGGRCEACQGEGVVQIEMQFLADLYLQCEACKGKRFKQDVLEIRYRGKNVADILEMTVDEAVEFFEDVAPVFSKLKVLQEVGMGYITLGQPATTLSGGEAQRLKLAHYLARPAKEHTLYIFDEPTTGLHFEDINRLLKAFNDLVDQGHSIILIEHNLDVIKSADWLIDMGPEGGRQGGFVVAQGTPEELAQKSESHTGRFLGPLLPKH